MMTAAETCLELYDTGQLYDKLGTKELAPSETAELVNNTSHRLRILQHDIHRLDETADGMENVMSTLKGFTIRVGVFSNDGDMPLDTEDGIRLKAKLVYENGLDVEELSATLEPPLLGGTATLQNGTAVFKLRITVLSSLCRGNRFRVQIDSEVAELNVVTEPMRTITKLRRGPSNKKKDTATEVEPDSEGGLRPNSGLKRALELEGFLLEDFEAEAYGVASAALADGRTLSELWDEVNSNGSLLLDLQQQQRTLFRELRELREANQKLAEAL